MKLKHVLGLLFFSKFINKIYRQISLDVAIHVSIASIKNSFTLELTWEIKLSYPVLNIVLFSA